MTGTGQRAGVVTKNRIMSGAADLFSQNGYRSTSMRNVAEKAGLQVSSLYRHVAGKQDLLYTVLDRLMDEVLEAGTKALAEGADPPDRLRHLIHNNICLVRPQEAALLQSELGNLEPRYRSRLIEKRDAYQRMWLSVLEDGVERGDFVVQDAKVVFFGIIGAVNYVEFWHSPSGNLSRAEVAGIFADWILKSLEVP